MALFCGEHSQIEWTLQSSLKGLKEYGGSHTENSWFVLSNKEQTMNLNLLNKKLEKMSQHLGIGGDGDRHQKYEVHS